MRPLNMKIKEKIIFGRVFFFINVFNKNRSLGTNLELQPNFLVDRIVDILEMHTIILNRQSP